MVAAEEVEEAGLRAGGALDAAEGEVPLQAVELFEVQEHLLEPEAGALADGRQLRGLEVGGAELGLRAVLHREVGQAGHHAAEARADELEGLAGLDEVGVVADVGAGAAEVDDPLGLGRGDAVGVDVRHDVVPAPLLLGARDLPVDVVLVRAELVDLLLRDDRLAVGALEPELELRLRDPGPHPAPGRVLELGGPDALHLLRAVARVEGAFEDVVGFGRAHVRSFWRAGKR